jgi:hypothetical protein
MNLKMSMFLKGLFFYGLFCTLILFFYISSYAAPIPLGLELNKTTASDLIKKYKIIRKEQNYWQGYNYFLDIKNFNSQNILQALVICNNSNIVEAVVLTIDKSKFKEFYNILVDKYTLIKEEIKSPYDKKVVFADDNCLIILEYFELNNEVELIYITDNFYKEFLNKLDQEEKAQKEQIKNLL